MADLPLRKMVGFLKGVRVGTKNPGGGTVLATPTVKKGGPISQERNRFAGITKWKCAPEQIANFPTYAPGAEWPTLGINATIKGKLSQSQNGGPIQNGVQFQNGTQNGGPIKNGGPIQNGVQIQNGTQDGGPIRNNILTCPLKIP
jgi:hypothetical protein